LVLTDVYIQGKSKKSEEEKQERKDYFGISVYSQEDIAVVVLFTDNLSRGDIHIHIIYYLVVVSKK
jgi:hypothetical protein